MDRVRLVRGWTISMLLVLGAAHVALAEPIGRDVDHDPWESVNRKTFWFNEQLDYYVLEPVARAWDTVAPELVQRSVLNFFSNIRFPIVAGNDVLQGKLRDGTTETGRFLVNSTIGVAGFFDPASSWGLLRREEDFGQTLGWWGLGTGPFVVLPVFGPSTVRDTFGLLGDYPLSVTPFFVDQFVLLGARTAEVVNARAQVLDEVRDAREASLDFYTFARNAYLQRRTALVSDMAEMTVEQEDELYYFDDAEEEE